MNKDVIEIFQDYINDDGDVYRYNYDKKLYYNTGISLKGTRGAPGPPGRPGKDGRTPRIGENGNWYVGDIDTGVKATQDNVSQTVEENDSNPVSGGAVYSKIQEVIGSASELLDTLGEIAAALNNDANLAGTLTTQISSKIPKVSNPTNGNIPVLAADGTLTDSGHAPSEYVEKSDMVVPKVNANGHEYVDLGLPSGTLWAACNVGASAPEGYGNYYMYGYTTPYSKSDTPYSGTENPLSLEHDTARVIWGGDWRMPTKAEFDELETNTTMAITYVGSHKCFKFTASNGKYIILPCGGMWNPTNHTENNIGYYWTSSNAYNFQFQYSGGGTSSQSNKSFGCSVRGVLSNSSYSPKYATKQELATGLSGKADKSEMSVTPGTGSNADKTTIQLESGTSATVLTQHQDISGKLDSAKSVTYSQLVGLRTNSGLVAGQLYRITDFVTTVNSEEVEARSAGHQFDVIVRADSANTLNENAWAAKHAGDTYFANSRLEAWQLKYMLDNEYWSDATNGKGVITWMKDEFDNECPYDFKNVQYKRYKVSDPKNREAIDGKYVGCGGTEPIDDLTMDSSDFKWYYTFSARDDTFITIEDFTLDEMCYSNRIERDEETHGQLSNNVFCFYNYTAHDNILKGPYSVNNSFIVDAANGNYIAGASDNICVCIRFEFNVLEGFTGNLTMANFYYNSIKAGSFGQNIIEASFWYCSVNGETILMNTFTSEEEYGSLVDCVFYSNEFVVNTISVGTGVINGTANFYGDMSEQTITLPAGECFVSTDSNGNLVIWNPADCPTKSEVAQTMVASQSVRNVVVLTQQEYDALATKDNYTEYNIV